MQCQCEAGSQEGNGWSREKFNVKPIVENWGLGALYLSFSSAFVSASCTGRTTLRIYKIDGTLWNGVEVK
jgi:hypothetical protein